LGFYYFFVVVFDMAEIIVEIPEDLKRVVEKYKLIDWSGVASEAIRKVAAELELFNAVVSESKLVEEDSLELGRRVKRGMWERVYKKLV
jgi:hypothetical protein